MYEFYGVPLVGDWLSFLGTIPASIYAGYRYISYRIKYRLRRRFWSGSADSINVFTPLYNQNTARIEDVLAYNYIFSELKNLKIDSNRMGVGSIHDSGNSIILCGPKSHTQSNIIQETHKLRLELMETDGKFAIYDHFSGNWTHSPSDISDDKKDIAIIGRIKKRNREGHYIFSWGVHGVGTLGGAKFFSDDEFIKVILREIGDKDFISTIIVEYEDIMEISSIQLHSKIYIAEEIYQ